jgi:hypothetical protein
MNADTQSNSDTPKLKPNGSNAFAPSPARGGA